MYKFKKTLNIDDFSALGQLNALAGRNDFASGEEDVEPSIAPADYVAGERHSSAQRAVEAQ